MSSINEIITIVMKKTKKPKNPRVFSTWVFSKKPIGSNQIGPNQAHPDRDA